MPVMEEMAEMADMQLVVEGMGEMEEIVDLVMEETGEPVVMEELAEETEEMVATEHRNGKRVFF
jgi:hypothetical protein